MRSSDLVLVARPDRTDLLSRGRVLATFPTLESARARVLAPVGVIDLRK